MISARAFWILIQCEAAALSRCRALRTATLIYVAALALFVFGWGDSNVDVRARTIEIVLLAVLLPWVAARCAAVERGDDLVILSAVLGVRPTQVLMARAVAVTVALSVVMLSGAPVMILAHRIAAGSASGLIGVFTSQFVMVIATTATLLGVQHWSGNRVRVWLAVGTVAAATAIVIQVLR